MTRKGQPKRLRRSEASDNSTRVQFLVGLCLGLIPWGLSLIGITLNFWLGLILLIASFGFLAHVFWILVQWPNTWRVGTLILAAAAYFGFIGLLLRMQHQELTPSPAPHVSLSPTVPLQQESTGATPTPVPSPPTSPSALRSSNSRAKTSQRKKVPCNWKDTLLGKC
jgi:hypothetical protein